MAATVTAGQVHSLSAPGPLFIAYQGQTWPVGYRLGRRYVLWGPLRGGLLPRPRAKSPVVELGGATYPVRVVR